MKRRPGVERRRRRLANYIYSQAQSPPPETTKRLRQLQAAYNYKKQKVNFDAEYQRLGAKQGPFNGVINLLHIPGMINNAWGKIAIEIEAALRAIDSKNLVLAENPSGGTYLPAQQVSQSKGELFRAAKNLLSALDGLSKLQQGIVKKTNLNSALSRFKDGNNFVGRLRAALNKDQLSDADLAAFIRQALSKNFRSDIGFIMEEVVTGMLNSTAFGDYMESNFQRIIDGSSFVTTSAQMGTIRAYVQGLSYTKDGKLMTGKPSGQPLRDTTLIWHMDNKGNGTITVDNSPETLGISSKRYNLTGNNKIKIAGLSVRNFADVFYNLGKDQMYLYRIFKGGGSGNSNGAAYYLAAQKLESIYFGQTEETDLPISDRTDLMVINGQLMGVSTFMKNSSGEVVTSKMPKKDSKWIKPNDVLSTIGQIHAAKILVYSVLDTKAKQALGVI